MTNVTQLRVPQIASLNKVIPLSSVYNEKKKITYIYFYVHIYKYICKMSLEPFLIKDKQEM